MKDSIRVAATAPTKRLSAPSPSNMTTPSSSLSSRAASQFTFDSEKSTISISKRKMRKNANAKPSVSPLDKLCLAKQQQKKRRRVSTSSGESSPGRLLTFSASSASKSSSKSKNIPLRKAIKLRKLMLEVEKKRVERETANKNLQAELERTKQVELNLELQREINKGYELQLEKRKIKASTPSPVRGTVSQLLMDSNAPMPTLTLLSATPSEWDRYRTANGFYKPTAAEEEASKILAPRVAEEEAPTIPLPSRERSLSQCDSEEEESLSTEQPRKEEEQQQQQTVDITVKNVQDVTFHAQPTENGAPLNENATKKESTA